MEFEGTKLLCIVAKQNVGLAALDIDGKPERSFQNPKDALKHIAAGGYFGVGNHRRIRYIQPKSAADAQVIWCSRSGEKPAAGKYPVSRRASRLKQDPGAATWAQQLRDAKSGNGAAATTIWSHPDGRLADDPSIPTPRFYTWPGRKPVY